MDAREDRPIPVSGWVATDGPGERRSTTVRLLLEGIA